MEKRDRHQGHVTGLLRQWRETREHEKRARMRRERWEEIREAAQELHGDIAGASGSRPALYPNTGPHGSQYPPRPLPNLVEQTPTNDQIGDARGGRGVLLILAPMVAAVTAVVTLAGATPVVSGSWSPLIGGLGVLLLCGLVFLWRLQWRRGVTGSTRVVGIILGVVVLAAGLIGVHGQQVVDGKAIRRGSEISAALSMLDRMEESLRVLRENQGLLDLPDEQARPLMGVFAAAAAQAERIGQIWNPATAGDLALPEMLEAHNQLNIAAARQQEALELRAATLANPEPGIAARADAAGREANAIIVNALPNTLSTCTRLLTEMVQGGQR